MHVYGDSDILAAFGIILWSHDLIHSSQMSEFVHTHCKVFKTSFEEMTLNGDTITSETHRCI